jgi:predicted RNase H-like nuclease (RuvC/YqgF family)
VIVDLKESLEREIREVRAGISRLEIRFDNRANRLDRHAALLQTGSRWSARMNEWAEKVDEALEAKDRQISELSGRLEKLERRNRYNGHPST